MKWLLNSCFLILVFLLSGCATIVRGPRQSISISSSPMGAVFQAGETTGTTPAIVRLPRKEDQIVVIQKAGFEPASIPVVSTFDPLPLIGGNIISWGPLGMIVDFATGSSRHLEPNAINVNLIQVDPTIKRTNEVINITPIQKTPIKPKDFYIGPRIGYSPITGYIGLEAQVKNFAIGLGLGYVNETIDFEENIPFSLGGIYYFDSWQTSPYLSLIYNKFEVRGLEKTRIGFLAGYRWRFDGCFDVNLGAGLGKEEEEYNFDNRNYSSSEDKTCFLINATFGYSF